MQLHLQKHRINRQLRQQSTRAMTMIELLVVITIILVLTGVMIPTIRYQYRNRALREAERQLNAFIGSAQARAQQLGRPVGIWIERFSESETLIGANYAVAIYIAEIPRPYTGETRNELVRVDLDQMNNILYLRFNNSTLSGNRLIKPMEYFKIQFAHRGPYYTAMKTDNDEYVLERNPNFGRVPIPTAEVSVGPHLLRPELTKGVPYRIQRRPKKSFLPPLRLPAGAVIDLSVSGIGSDGEDFWTHNKKNTEPVIIMFQADGSIERVLHNNIDKRPLGWVHLLVGRQNQVFPEIEILDPKTKKPIGFNRFTDESTETGNVMDMENRWVSINHRTGSITSEQVVGNIPPIEPSDWLGRCAGIGKHCAHELDPLGKLRIAAARELVRSGTGSGGN